jgi:hypothetical protein
MLNVEDLDIRRIEYDMLPMVYHRIKVLLEVALSEILKFRGEHASRRTPEGR